MSYSLSLPICHLSQVSLHDCVDSNGRPHVPPDLARFFRGILANREWAADPIFDHQTGWTLEGPSRVFVGTYQGKNIGAVLVTDINQPHRRCCVHISVIESARDRKTAKAMLCMAASVMAESFGMERFWTYVRPESHGQAIAEAVGMAPEGYLRLHALTPYGREDTLILGGHWPDLRLHCEDTLKEIQWVS